MRGVAAERSDVAACPLVGQPYKRTSIYILEYSNMIIYANRSLKGSAKTRVTVKYPGRLSINLLINCCLDGVLFLTRYKFNFSGNR